MSRNRKLRWFWSFGIRAYNLFRISRFGFRISDFCDRFTHDLSDKVYAVSDVTQILQAIEQGDAHAAERLLPLVYHELRRIAAKKMRRESPDHTLQPTALVHEAYLRLVDVEQAGNWNSRGHFFAAAAEAMRRILVESARRKATRKRGGDLNRVDMADLNVAADTPADKLIALDEALARLAKVDPTKADVVKLRYFAGLTIQETADALGISTATADRHWAYARAWLQNEISAVLDS